MPTDPTRDVASDDEALLARAKRFHWQCSGCHTLFARPWQKLCPVCGREDYWSGSHILQAFAARLREVLADLAAKDAEIARLQTPRLAPVQGHEPIPWSVHLRAYEGYAKRLGASQTADRLAERGGFGVSELDMFHPTWRAECEELPLLRAELDTLKAQLAEAIHPRPR
jgi:hypothetical protein